MVELSKELALLIIGVILGALASGTVQWKISHDEQEDEQRNIAQALYIDISHVDEIFNDSMSGLSLYANNTSILDTPSYVMGTTRQFYSSNGLYYTFSKEISDFDSETSTDIYVFYTNVIDIENKRCTAVSIIEKYLRGEQITQYDLIRAHTISKALYEIDMPYCIRLGEKIKGELGHTYGAKMPLGPTVIFDQSPEIYNLSVNGQQIQILAG